MVVETTDRKQTFNGGQSSLTFTFRTLVSNPEYIKVALVLLSDSTQTDLTYSTDYTVSVNTDGVGGIVTVNPSYSTAYNYVVYRETMALQASDYTDFNQFPADTLETNIDQLTMIAQELSEDSDRTLIYPISASSASTILPVPLANAFISWNAGGTALINSVIPDPSTLVKATNADATTGTDDTKFMTPAKVKTEVENPGTVSIPSDNLGPISDSKLDTISTAGKVSGAALTLLSSIPSGAGLIPIANLITAFQFVVKTFDMSSATGTISVTGAGFTPRGFILIGAQDSLTTFSIGWADGTNDYSIWDQTGGSSGANNWGVATTACAVLKQSGGIQILSFNAFTSDGVTLVNTKSSSPSGAVTCTLLFIFFK